MFSCMAGLLFLPAVSDFTNNFKRLFEVDGIRNHLQGQSDISIARCLEDT